MRHMGGRDDLGDCHFGRGADAEGCPAGGEVCVARRAACYAGRRRRYAPSAVSARKPDTIVTGSGMTCRVTLSTVASV